MTTFATSLALLIATEIRPSTLSGVGEGVFALEDVARGRFVGMDFPAAERAVGEAEVLELPPELRRYSWRHVERVCFAGRPDVRVATDFLNHSFEPNLHWHLGHYFTLRDVRAGDELFLDYRGLLDPAWSGRMRDAASGRPIDGTEWREALVRSCRTLIELLDGDP